MALIDDIRALPVEITGQQDTQVIAAALPPVVTHQPRLITERGVLAALPVPAGDQLLTAIEQFAAASLPEGHPLAAYHGTIRRGISWLKAEGLDLGDPLSRSLLLTLANAGIVSTASVTTLLALAEVSTPVSEMDVRRVCWSDEGVWQV